MQPDSVAGGGRVMIIAGETSGDNHGARLVAAMRKLDENLSFFGVGGAAMKREGVEIIADASTLSVVGITEVFSRLPGLLRGMSSIKRTVAQRKPGLAVLIDFPDFNLHMARYVKRLSIPVLYYISPQIWAWRSGRIRRIKKYVDRMAVILPFEKDFYNQHGVPVTFVGHPVLDYYPGDSSGQMPVTDNKKTVIGLLPGSRSQEIRRNLPVMLAAANRVSKKKPSAGFVVSVAPGMDYDEMETYIRPHRKMMNIRLQTGDIGDLLSRCTLVIAASGTVTLETAVYGVPMVIVYRVSQLSYMLGRALISVEHIGLANIIAQQRVVPELLQRDATPSNIARLVTDIIDDPEKLEQIRQKLRMVREQLGSPGASQKTAGIAYSMMQKA